MAIPDRLAIGHQPEPSSGTPRSGDPVAALLFLKFAWEVDEQSPFGDADYPVMAWQSAVSLSHNVV